MIDRLLLFGVSGDLTARYLLPALAALHEARALPPDFAVLGAATRDWNDARLRTRALRSLDQHAPGLSHATRDRLARALRYRRVDFDDPRTVEAVVEAASGGEPVAAYLALPPQLYPSALEALWAAGLPRGSRIALEKPFGEDHASAMALNALLARRCGTEVERTIFRVDHVLGMGTVLNLIGLRAANPPLDAFWNSRYVEQVDVLWDETIALEGRAKFYDRAGALKDVMQNHMMQLLTLFAMEPCARFEEGELREHKVGVLRAIRPMDLEDAARRSRRARYTAGRLADGREVPSYVDEPGVDPARDTETFAEVVLHIDNARWAGTRFVLRAGKALATRRNGIEVHFRPAAAARGEAAVAPASLWIGIDGPENLALTLTGLQPSSPPRYTPLTLETPFPKSALPAYARVLVDLLRGDSTLSVRGDEAELAWKVLTPVLDAWKAGRVELESYPAGSNGPGRSATTEAGAEPVQP